MHIYYSEVNNSKIASHNLNNSCQCNSFYIKDTGKEKLMLLSGYITLSEGNEVNFKRGWYNQDLEFIADITEVDQRFINNCLPY